MFTNSVFTAASNPMFVSKLNRLLLYCMIITAFKLSLLSASVNNNNIQDPPSHERQHQVPTYIALLNLTYRNPVTNVVHTERKIQGAFGYKSIIDNRKGRLIHVTDKANTHHGCQQIANSPGYGDWIALIKRGNCTFEEKIINACIKGNASAAIIYDNVGADDEHAVERMNDKVDQAVSIHIPKSDGSRLADLLDNGTEIYVVLDVKANPRAQRDNISKTSVLFVSISFIVLMIISLAWLVFYYIQRFRYAHAKERLSKRLMNSAKKAVTKMPVRTVRSGDRETESDFDQCAVCIEGYKSTDVIRILPCKHVFHKSCVDPWLIEQRNCPMCKMDILKAYGLQIHEYCSNESVNMDGDNTDTSLGNEPLSSARQDLNPQGSISAAAELEMVRYTPNTVPKTKYRGAAKPTRLVESTSNCDGDDVIGEEDEAGHSHSTTGTTCAVVVDPQPQSYSHSMDSVHSIESETNELQSLMPTVVVAQNPPAAAAAAAAVDSSTTPAGSVNGSQQSQQQSQHHGAGVDRL